MMTQRTLSVKAIKSLRSVGARSIPKSQRSSSLELYTLGTVKDRLEKEAFALDKRRDTVKRQLDDTKKRIKKLQKEVYQEQEVKTHKCVPTKPLKTMAINY
ncbi:hypothetical protein KKC91_12180 [bacterium]|nr:hypothetical protein [bacterium]